MKRIGFLFVVLFFALFDVGFTQTNLERSESNGLSYSAITHVDSGYGLTNRIEIQTSELTGARYAKWRKSFSSRSISGNQLKMDMFIPSWITGDVVTTITLKKNSGEFANSNFVYPTRGSGWQTYTFVLNSSLGSLDSLVITTSIPQGQSGTRVVFLDNIRMGNDTLDNGGGSSTNQIPARPSLMSPGNLSSGLATTQTLQWYTSANATSYRLQISTSSSFSGTVFDGPIYGTTYQFTGISGVAYYWRVNASNQYGTSLFSDTWSFTMSQTSQIPGKPNLLMPTNLSSLTTLNTTLLWGQVTGASDYVVQVSTSYDFSSFAVNTISTSALYSFSSITNATYYWRIAARNNAGTGQWSDVWSFTMNMSGQIPGVPVLVYPAAYAYNVPKDLTCTWSSATNAAYYEFQIAENYSFTEGMLSYQQTGTSQTLSLSSGKTYYWKVRAGNNFGTSGWSEVRTFQTTSGSTGSAPGAPQLVLPVNGGYNIEKNTTLQWNPVSNADSYRLQISTNGNFSNPFEIPIVATSYTFSGSEGTTYYWRVYAINSYGSTSSVIWTYSTKSGSTGSAPSAPDLLNPASGYETDKNTTVTLKWSLPSTATSYNLLIARDMNFTDMVLDKTLSAYVYTHSTSFENYGTYYWKVIAINQYGQTSSLIKSIVVKQGEIAPVAPTLVSPDNNANVPEGLITFSWNSVPNAINYRLQISVTSMFTVTTYDRTMMTNSVNVSLIGGLTYHWRVLASNNMGISEWSEVRKVIVGNSELQKPTLVTPSNGATRISLRPTFTWNADIKATESRLQILNSQYVIISDIRILNDTYVAMQNLEYNQTYYWRVKSSNAEKESEWSDVSQFRTMQSPTTDIADMSSVPKELKLYQNYPNPFNPSTRILYGIAEASHVRISVLDAMGREIEQLVNEVKQPGMHEVVFNASKISSGVYFYKISDGKNMCMKRMILVK